MTLPSSLSFGKIKALWVIKNVVWDLQTFKYYIQYCAKVSFLYVVLLWMASLSMVCSAFYIFEKTDLNVVVKKYKHSATT